jgi:hypothetical protein
MEYFLTLKLSQLENFKALKLSRLENLLTLKLKLKNASEIFPLYKFWKSCVFSAKLKAPFLHIKMTSDQKVHIAKCFCISILLYILFSQLKLLQGDSRRLCFIISLWEMLQNMRIFYHFCWPYIWTFWYSMCTELLGP